jgi:hypothetical protein
MNYMHIVHACCTMVQSSGLSLPLILTGLGLDRVTACLLLLCTCQGVDWLAWSFAGVFAPFGWTFPTRLVKIHACGYSLPITSIKINKLLGEYATLALSFGLAPSGGCYMQFEKGNPPEIPNAPYRYTRHCSVLQAAAQHYLGDDIALLLCYVYNAC